MLPAGPGEVLDVLVQVIELLEPGCIEDDGHVNLTVRTWMIVDTVAAVAAEIGATSGQVSLAWLEAQPGATAVILGARTVAQLSENLVAASVALSPTQLERLSAVSAPVVSDYPYGAAALAQRDRQLPGGR